MRRQLPLLLVAITAFFVMAMKFFNFGEVGAAAIQEADIWIQVTYEFAFLLGAINFTRLHYGNVARKRPKWVYSVVALIAMVLTCIITLVDGVNGEIAMFLYENVAVRIDGAIYALLGFYVFSGIPFVQAQEPRSRHLAGFCSASHACPSSHR